jgi:hypothetical protein
MTANIHIFSKIHKTVDKIVEKIGRKWNKMEKYFYFCM